VQLKDLVRPIDQMTDDELRERLREIRHRRTVVRPAHQKKKAAPAKKAAKAKVSKVDAMLKSMTPEQIQQLLKDLGEG